MFDKRVTLTIVYFYTMLQMLHTWESATGNNNLTTQGREKQGNALSKTSAAASDKSYFSRERPSREHGFFDRLEMLGLRAIIMIFRRRRRHFLGTIQQ
jgi:hypothetical protein